MHGMRRACAAAAQSGGIVSATEWLRALADARLAGAEAGEALRQSLGFSLSVQESRISGAGRGVFLVSDSAEAGALLTLYPGMMYSPDLSLPRPSDDAFQGAPAFMLANNYLLQTHRGDVQLLIDARPRGLSADIFQMAAGCAGVVADACWLDQGCLPSSTSTPCSRCQFVQQRPASARALGHLLNHPPAEVQASVAFKLVALGEEMPDELLKLLPNIHSSGLAPTPRWVRPGAAMAMVLVSFIRSGTMQRSD
jgi:hypothetical protein